MKNDKDNNAVAAVCRRLIALLATTLCACGRPSVTGTVSAPTSIDLYPVIETSDDSARLFELVTAIGTLIAAAFYFANFL